MAIPIQTPTVADANVKSFPGISSDQIQVAGVAPYNLSPVEAPLSSSQITVGSTALSLSAYKPLTATRAEIFVETNTIRWWDDGKTPTTTQGLPVPAGQSLIVESPSTFKFIAASGSASVTVAWYSPDPVVSNTLQFPIRGTFYYPWYAGTNGSTSNWFDKVGCNLSTPYSCAAIHMPDAGYYIQSYNKARTDIANMKQAKIQLGISSWFGSGHRTDTQFPTLLQAAADDGGGFRWCLYYEKEGSPGVDPPVSEIQADLDYVATNYINHPNYLWKDNKPVIFVYTNGGDCEDMSRWSQATNGFQNWYVNPQVFGGYQACPNQPSSWHQYAGEAGGDHQPGFSFTITPEVWLWQEANPRVPRDLTRFKTDVRAMVASNEPWQLILTYNEWGESTSIEPGTHKITGQSWGMSYINALATDGV